MTNDPQTRPLSDYLDMSRYVRRYNCMTGKYEYADRKGTLIGSRLQLADEYNLKLETRIQALEDRVTDLANMVKSQRNQLALQEITIQSMKTIMKFMLNQIPNEQG